MSKPLRHFWEGRDTAGREVRAFLATANTSGLTVTIPLRMTLPVVVFRVRRDWVADRRLLEERSDYVKAVNEMNQRYGGPLKRAPKPKGSTWVVAAYVELRDVQACKKLGTALGLESVFRAGMARLTTEQLSTLSVALDAWLESDGRRSLAKQLRTEAT